MQPIKNYEGIYSITTDGRVFSHKRGIYRKLSTHRQGYKLVTLNKQSKIKAFLVHRLVAQTFLQNQYNKPEINHINGNKADNTVANLEWVTAKQNTNHAKSNGLRPSQIGENNARALLNWQIVAMLRAEYTPGYGNIKRLAKKYNLKPQTVGAVVRNKNWAI